jgi:protein-tyrosine-phosphatase
MAEVLFRQLLEEKGETDAWRVESAGVWAYHGAKATQNAQDVVADRGLDLSGHRSQPSDPALLKQFDVIIVMEVEHKQVLQERNPSLAERILTLRELVGDRGDFADPVGGSIEVYEAAAEEIYTILNQAFSSIESKSKHVE